MKKLFYHRVQIYKKPTPSYRKDKFEITEVEILAENDHLIIINNYHFTRLEKKGSGICHPIPNRERIDIRCKDDILGDGVFYTLYSDKKSRPSTIKLHIEKEIYKKFGWLVNDIDLSIIK